MECIRPLTAGLVAVSMLVPACRRGSEPPPGPRYPVRGKVVSVDVAARSITIDHEEIPGFMPAMTMPFVVLEKDAALLSGAGAGDEVQATLVSRDSRFWLEDLVIVRKGTPDPKARSQGFREARPGDMLPDVALVDQDGHGFRTSDLRGHATALTFVFTRCPLPEFCPLMMRNFSRAEALLVADDGLRARTRLLTVSFDTSHDTPGVLLRFGRPFQKTTPPFSHWRLATGSAAAIRTLGEALELDYVEEKQSFTHNLRTAVVGPDGRLRRLLRGNEWTPEELVAELRAAVP